MLRWLVVMHETFDFVYLINVIHHVPGREARDQALREVLRVLREGGILFLHEINTENPLFRFYMGYVFPFIRRIDDGTEEWTLPSCLPDVTAQQWRDRIVFFTFLPEFVPRWLFKLFAGLELALERSRFRHYSAHFMASLVKAPVPRSMVQVYDEPPQLSSQRLAPRLGP